MNWNDIVARMAQAGVDQTEAESHVRYLRSAVQTGRPQILHDYIQWCRHTEISRHGNDLNLANALRVMQDYCSELASPDAANPLSAIASGLTRTSDAEAPATRSFLDADAAHGWLALEYFERVRSTDRRGATRVVLEALDDGLSVSALYEHVLTPCLHEIGRLWENNELSVGQEHYFTAVTQTVMAHIYPRVFSAEPGEHRLLAATIEGNLHEISIRMVADFFELAGWDTHYLGADAPNNEVIQTARRHRPHVIAISIALAAQLDRLQDLVADIRADPQIAETRILVGGSGLMRLPESDREVGADAFSATAVEAIRIAEDWMAT